MGKKIKVCHVTSVHPRYDGRIFRRMCSSLAQNNYDVTLLVADNRDDEIKNDVKIVHVDPKFKNRVDRIFNSSNILLPKALEVDADVYHLHDPELLKLGVMLKKRGKKVIFDSHEDYTINIETKSWIPKVFRKPAKKVYEKYERRALKKFDGVVGVDLKQIERLKTINSKTICVANFPIMQRVERAIRSDNETKYICFAGLIEPKWSHENVIKAIAKFNGKVRYLLMGHIRDEYKKLLKETDGFEYVDLLGRVSFEEVLKNYAKSDIGVVLHDYTPTLYNKRGSIGVTKLFEVMMAELPVVCTDFVIWKDIVETNKAGICINPNDSNAVYEAIDFLINNKETAIEYGRNGCNIVANKYNWETQIDTLLSFYNNIIGDNGE